MNSSRHNESGVSSLGKWLWLAGALVLAVVATLVIGAMRPSSQDRLYAEIGKQVYEGRVPIAPVAKLLTEPFPVCPGTKLIEESEAKIRYPNMDEAAASKGLFTLHWQKTMVLDAAGLNARGIQDVAGFYASHLHSTGLTFGSGHFWNYQQPDKIYNVGELAPEGYRWESHSLHTSDRGSIQVQSFFRDLSGNSLSSEERNRLIGEYGAKSSTLQKLPKVAPRFIVVSMRIVYFNVSLE